MELSIIIPVYHKAADAAIHLPAVYPALKKKFSSFEIIFIIDNEAVSNDVAAVYNLQQQYNEISVYQLHKNYGQHFATLCGYYLAKGDAICTIDEDMTQYLDIADCTTLQNGTDALYYCYNKSKMYNSYTRKILSALFKLMVHTILNIEDHSTFRIISLTLKDKLLSRKHVFWNVDVMIYANAEHIKLQYISLDGITDDNSSYNIRKLMEFAFKIIFEHINLLLCGALGLLPAIAYLLLHKNLLNTAMVYIATVAVLSFISFVIKKITPTTEEKIETALQLHAVREVAV